MSTRIGVLLAGFGGIGTQNHQTDMYLPAFLAHPDFEIVGAVDVAGSDGAAKAALEHGVRHLTDLTTALADPAVTLVSLAVPVEARAAALAQVIAAGKHVLADKPLTASLTEARNISRQASEQGVIVVPAHHLRLGGALRAVRGAVRAGRVGLPWNVQVDFYVAGGEPAPSGELLNLALYPVDIVLDLLGLPVRRVFARAGRQWGGAPQDLVTLMLDHARGVTSTIVCARIGALNGVPAGDVAMHRYRISGSHAVLAVDATKPGLTIRTSERTTTTWTGPGTVDSLLDVVRDGVRTGRAQLGPADAVAVARVIDAATRSLAAGAPIDISDENESEV